MSIYVVRHGQTDWNVQNILQGCTNIPLNETGLKQAHELKNNIKNIKIDLLISSPLNRTLSTAKIINVNNLPIITDVRLLERGFGELEGIKGTDYDIHSFWDYERNLHYKNAECIQDFFKRVYSFLNDLEKNYPDKNVLLVTHNGVAIAIDCYFNGFPKDNNLLKLGIQTCSFKEYSISKV